VRRAVRPFVVSLFGLAAVAGAAVPGVAFAAVWLAASGAVLTTRIVGWMTMGSLALDVAYRRGLRIARPLAVFRQVPRSWGHIVGPWWAAVRYGFRMGFGPATILVSWSWWVGFVVTASAGPVSAVIGAVTFAVARTVTMALATADVIDGTAMARRAALVDLMGGVATKVSMVITLAVGAFGLAS
jgi:hypothetical protein